MFHHVSIMSLVPSLASFDSRNRDDYTFIHKGLRATLSKQPRGFERCLILPPLSYCSHMRYFWAEKDSLIVVVRLDRVALPALGLGRAFLSSETVEVVCYFPRHVCAKQGTRVRFSSTTVLLFLFKADTWIVLC